MAGPEPAIIAVVEHLLRSARSAVLRTFQWTDGHADFAALFRDAETLAQLGPALAAPFGSDDVTVVAALEARGFVVGSLCAQQLRVGLVLARKPGGVYPGEKVEVVSAEDWRGHRVAIRVARVLNSADRVLLVDDWIETGSQARAVKDAVEACGATFVGTSVVVDDTTAEVRADLNVVSLLQAGDLPRSRPSS